MTGRPVVEGGRSPIGPLLVGGGGSGLAAFTVVTLVAATQGSNQIRSSLIGGGMALLTLALAPTLHLLCRRLDPTLTTGIVVMVYGGVIIALGVGYSAIDDAPWLVGGFAGCAVLLVAAAWAAGHIRAALRLRQPIWPDLHR